VEDYYDGGEKRTLGAAVVAGALIVATSWLWFGVLAESSDEPNAAGRERSASRPLVRPHVKAGKLNASRPGGGPLQTFEMFAPKDPFEPLVASGGSGGSGGSDDDSSGSDFGSPGLGGEEVGGHRVTLLDVFEDKGEPRAQVQVDSSVYTVAEGEMFADNFKLLSASGDCASMLFGDDQFSLCEGEEILK
jgi:hypothetical protein